MFIRNRMRWLRPLLLFVSILILGALAAPSQPAQAISTTNGVIVVVWPTPSVIVTRGGPLVYEIQAKNFNRSAQNNIRVYIPYNSEQLTITGAETSGDDWVSELSDIHALVTFRRLEGSEARTVRLYAEVAPNLPDGTVITTWPSYSWADSRSERAPVRGNAVPVIVGLEAQTSPYTWMNAEPRSAPATTTFGFFSDRFLPFETVQAALAAPGATPVELDLTAEADDEGRVWLGYTPATLPPGDYELRVTGRLSNLQANAPFTITAAR